MISQQNLQSERSQKSLKSELKSNLSQESQQINAQQEQSSKNHIDKSKNQMESPQLSQKQQEFKSVFAMDEQNQELISAQRKQNDFVKFYKDSYTRPKYFNGKLYKEPQSKEELKQVQAQNLKQMEKQMIEEKKLFNSLNAQTLDSLKFNEGHKNRQQLLFANINNNNINDSRYTQQSNAHKNTQKSSELKNIKQENPQILSKTQQIDKFIQNQPDFAQTAITIPIGDILHQKNMEDPEYRSHYKFLQKRNNNLSNVNSTNQSSVLKSSFDNNHNNLTNGSNTNKSQVTYLFSGQPRFWKSSNANQGDLQKFNGIVGESTIQKNNTRYYPQQIIRPKLSVDIESFKNQKGETIEYLQNQDRIKDIYSKTLLPSQQQKEFREQKQKLTEYQQWKQEITSGLKKYNILKNGYRSGIMSIDSPFAQNTDIYKPEQQTLQEKQQKAIQIQINREKQLNKHVSTHPDIQFNNNNYSPQIQHRQQVNFQQQAQTPQQLHSSTNFQQQQSKRTSIFKPSQNEINKFPHQSYEFSRDWTNRKQGKNTCQKLPTFQNCFGHNLEDQRQKIMHPRSLYLREQDLKGKNYNPLTGVQLELKI